MQFRITFDPGQTLGYSVTRPDGASFDFADANFRAAPVDRTAPLVEGAGIFAGRYSASYSPTPGALWWDGHVIVTIHDLGPRPRAIVEFSIEFFKGVALSSYPPFYSF